jgi:predicted amidohydrolase
MKNLRIAAVTCRVPVGDIAYNLAQTVRWTHAARDAGADLVCFPELNITGYGAHGDIGTLAQPIPGPVSRRLSRLARETGLIVLAGMAEHNPDGRPFATHCAFRPSGRLARYRKVYLAPPEKPHFQPGDAVPVFRTPAATFGIQLCYDAHFPELSTAMTALGAHILFMPHASPRGEAAAKHQSWMRHLPARAFDNGVFVVACNQLGDNGKGLVFAGNAVVIGPSGNVLKKNVAGKEGLLVADLQAADLEAVRSHPMRYFFPNRRPDLYTTPAPGREGKGRPARPIKPRARDNSH